MADTATQHHNHQSTQGSLSLNNDRGLRKTRSGEVISSKMDKTIVVKTVTRVPHPRFGKIIKQVKKFHVHDEKNEAQVGDRVSIMETRPISRLKHWRLVEILEH